MTHSTFTHAPSCHPFDLVYSGRRRKRHKLKTLIPPVSELARRVDALPVPSENEVWRLNPLRGLANKYLRKGTPSDGTYNEHELLAFYDNLLALPYDGPAVTGSSPAELPLKLHDEAIVEAILSRISPSQSPSASSQTFSSLLQQRAEPTSPPECSTTQLHAQESRSSLPHHVALGLLTPIIRELESSQNLHAFTSGQSSPPIMDVPLAVLSVDEWRSLTRLCVSKSVHHTRRLYNAM